MLQLDTEMRKMMSELTPEQRLRAWLGLMRHAGGLRLNDDCKEVRAQVHLLERSCAKDGPVFREARNRILVANHTAAHFFEVNWFAAQSDLGRMCGLLSLAVLLGDKVARRKISRALAQRAGADQTGEVDVIAEFARYTGILLATDSPPLGDYWLENLKGLVLAPGGSTPPAKLEELLAQDPEALLRPIQHYAAEFGEALNQPLMILDILSDGYFKDVEIPVAECVLPPVDEYRKRNEAVLGALQHSPWGSALRRPELSREMTTLLEQVLWLPPEEIPGGAIQSYERWVSRP